MDKEKRDKIIKVMDMVAKDVEADAHNFEGKEFNGRNVGMYLGHNSASIKVVADAVKAILETPMTNRQIEVGIEIIDNWLKSGLPTHANLTIYDLRYILKAMLEAGKERTDE